MKNQSSWSDRGEATPGSPCVQVVMAPRHVKSHLDHRNTGNEAEAARDSRTTDSPLGKDSAHITARLTLIIVALSMLLPVWVRAHHSTITDSADTRGRLDAREVRTRGDWRRPEWRIITHRKWSARDTWDRGQILIHLNTRRDERSDYYALIFYNGRRMVGHLYRERRQQPARKVRNLKVWRPDRRSVSVRIPLKSLRIGSRRDFYVWNVQTLWSGPRCRRICMDFVPDESGVREPLNPEPISTATSTPTPTESPIPLPIVSAVPTPTLPPAHASDARGS